MGRSARQRHWLSISLLVLGAAGWSAAPSLLNLKGSLALAVGAGSAALVELVGLLREQRIRRRNVRSAMAAINDAGSLDPVSDLGLRRSSLGDAVAGTDASDRLPPYILGEIDRSLDEAFAESGFVLITGNSLAGKSRAAFEAMRRLRPKAEVLTLDGPAALEQLLMLDPPLLDTWRPIVVWIGDLGRFAGSWPERGGAGSSPSFPASLVARHLDTPRGRFLGRRVRVLFVATMPGREYDLLTKGGHVFSQGATASSMSSIVRGARRVHLDDGEAAGWDMDAARRLYPGVDFSPGIGRALAESELLVNAYRFGLGAVARAVVRACVDWRRMGVGDPAKERIHEMVREYLPDAIVEDEEIDEALRVVNAELASGQRLISRSGAGPVPRFHAHDCLVDADDGYGADATARPIPRSVWGIALSILSGPELLAVAETAVSRGELEIADMIWEAILAGGVPRDGADVLAAAYVDRAEAHSDDDPAAARADLDAAISLVGVPAATRAAAYQARGALGLNDADRYEEAEADFAEALAVRAADPETRARAFANRGVLRQDVRRPEDAEADFGAALAIVGASGNPRSHALAMRGILRLNRHEFALAAADSSAALALDGSRPYARAFAHLGLAEVLAEEEQFTEAEAHFQGAIDTVAGPYPELTPLFQVRYSTFLYLRERYAEAEAQCDKALLTDGIDAGLRVEALVGRARCREFGRVEEGIEDCDAALATGAGTPIDRANAYLTRGILRGAQEEWRAAERDITTAFDYPGTDPELRAVALLTRGLVRFRQKARVEEAEKDFSAVLEIAGAEPSTYAIAYYDRGVLRKRRREWDAAEMDLRESLKIPSSSTAEALQALTDLLRIQGRIEDEIAFYREALASRRKDLVPFAMARLEAHERIVARRAARRRR
jgi:tetratricopeptide (TPR) repeat protein